MKRQGPKFTTLIVYVDDIVTMNDGSEIARLRDKLAHEFEIKDWGSLKHSLAIEVAKSKRGIFLAQRRYVIDLLKEGIPLDANHVQL